MNAIPSAALLARLRTQAATSLGSTKGVIYTITNTPDGAGGWTPTRTASGTETLRINPAGGLTVNVAGAAVTEGVKYIGVMRYGATFNLKDEIDYGGNTYQVQQILHDADLTLDVFVKVELTRLV